MRRATIVVDLGFGDSGKGTVTDHLVRENQASMVVRFNGGAQAGHTVVTDDGRFHTFSQLGAGSFVPGVRTHLSRFMVVHPGGLLQEAKVLAGKGVPDILTRLSIASEARIVTPFQQSANRLREVLRGADRHGSCGLGIGETMADELEFPEDCVRASDLVHPDRLRSKLLRWQQRKWQLFREYQGELRADPTGAEELAVLESADVTERWVHQAGQLAQQVEIGPEKLPSTGSVVFEGAQGVLLDEWRGFHPHTTWSTCTFANALELLHDFDGEVTKLGVLRSYATRHGAGPFPTEDVSLNLDEPHNHKGAWQGGFRQGWFDAVLARYAIDACGGIDGLALTHLDRADDSWRVATAYRGLDQEYEKAGRLRLGTFKDLAYQERLGRALGEVTPSYEALTAQTFRGRVEKLLQVPICLESWGPTSQHKRPSVPIR